jgi:choline-sulfatase
VHREVIADQRRRRLLDRSLRKGEFQPWDFQPHRDPSQIYMRNHLDLNQAEECARFPPHGPGRSKEDIGE